MTDATCPACRGDGGHHRIEVPPTDPAHNPLQPPDGAAVRPHCLLCDGRGQLPPTMASDREAVLTMHRALTTLAEQHGLAGSPAWRDTLAALAGLHTEPGEGTGKDEAAEDEAGENETPTDTAGRPPALDRSPTATAGHRRRRALRETLAASTTGTGTESTAETETPPTIEFDPEPNTEHHERN